MLFHNNFYRLEKIFEMCAVDTDNRQEDHQINHVALSFLPNSDFFFKQFIFTIKHNGNFAGYLHISINVELASLELEHIYILHRKRNKLLSYKLIDNACAKLKELNIQINTVTTSRTTIGGEKCFNYLKSKLLRTANIYTNLYQNQAFPKRESRS